MLAKCGDPLSWQTIVLMLIVMGLTIIVVGAILTTSRRK